MIDYNGAITYMIQYTRVETSVMMSVIVNSGNTHIISGLDPFVDYSIIVAASAARTINGTGPISGPLWYKGQEKIVS